MDLSYFLNHYSHKKLRLDRKLPKFKKLYFDCFLIHIIILYKIYGIRKTVINFNSYIKNSYDTFGYLYCNKNYNINMLSFILVIQQV